MFTLDVMSIIEAGTSLIVGTVGPDGEPRASRAFALTVVDPDANVVRLVLSADDPIVVANLATGALAVTAADVRTLRSVQLKGRITQIEPPTVDDLATAHEHAELFFAAIADTDGHPPSLTRQLLPIDSIAVEMVVEELFDQTPGPSAGSRVAMP